MRPRPTRRPGPSRRRESGVADFAVDFTSGVALEPWDDPQSVSPDKPSRVNPQPEHIHKRQVGAVGVQVELTASVAGVAGPVDGTLGGELFSLAFHEAPALPFPSVSNPGGQSSVQHFTPIYVGHYTVQLTRPNHGAVILHVDVDS